MNELLLVGTYKIRSATKNQIEAAVAMMNDAKGNMADAEFKWSLLCDDVQIWASGPEAEILLRLNNGLTHGDGKKLTGRHWAKCCLHESGLLRQKLSIKSFTVVVEARSSNVVTRDDWQAWTDRVMEKLEETHQDISFSVRTISER